MKKSYKIGIRTTFVIILLFVLNANPILSVSSTEVVEEGQKTVMDKVQSSLIYVKITKPAAFYSDYGVNKRKLGEFHQDQVVELIRDRGYQWYLVKSQDGKIGWVVSDNIEIPQDPETNTDLMTKDEIEGFIHPWLHPLVKIFLPPWEGHTRFRTGDYGFCQLRTQKTKKEYGKT